MPGRRSSRRGMPLSVALAILAALFAVAVAAEAVMHLALLAVALGPSAVAFWAGRRYERRQVAQPSQITPVIRDKSASDPAAQVARLEHLASRPMSAIIASYELIQRKYGGPR